MKRETLSNGKRINTGISKKDRSKREVANIQ